MNTPLDIAAIHAGEAPPMESPANLKAVTPPQDGATFGGFERDSYQPTSETATATVEEPAEAATEETPPAETPPAEETPAEDAPQEIELDGEKYALEDVVDAVALRQMVPEGVDAGDAMQFALNCYSAASQGQAGMDSMFSALAEFAEMNGFTVPMGSATAPEEPDGDMFSLPDEENAMPNEIAIMKALKSVATTGKQMTEQTKKELKAMVGQVVTTAKNAEQTISAVEIVAKETGRQMTPNQIRLAQQKTGIADPVLAVKAHYYGAQPTNGAAKPKPRTEDLGGKDHREIKFDPQKMTTAQLVQLAKDNPEVMGPDYKPPWER